jgi:PAS domain S-box-containing protein
MDISIAFLPHLKYIADELIPETPKKTYRIWVPFSKKASVGYMLGALLSDFLRRQGKNENFQFIVNVPIDENSDKSYRINEELIGADFLHEWFNYHYGLWTPKPEIRNKVRVNTIDLIHQACPKHIDCILFFQEEIPKPTTHWLQLFHYSLEAEGKLVVIKGPLSKPIQEKYFIKTGVEWLFEKKNTENTLHEAAETFLWVDKLIKHKSIRIQSTIKKEVLETIVNIFPYPFLITDSNKAVVGYSGNISRVINKPSIGDRIAALFTEPACQKIQWLLENSVSSKNIFWTNYQHKKGGIHFQLGVLKQTIGDKQELSFIFFREGETVDKIHDDLKLREEWMVSQFQLESYSAEMEQLNQQLSSKNTELIQQFQESNKINKKLEIEKESRRKLEIIALKTHSAVILTNNKQEIEWVNESFIQLTGYQLAELIGKNPRIFQGEGTDKQTISRIAKGLKKKQEVREVILNYHKNGSPYWVELSITPVLDDQGNITHFISIQQDVTEKIQTQQVLEQLTMQLSLQNEDLMNYSYIVSHNLRAPIANIMGLLDLCADKEQMEKDHDSILEMLRSSADQLNQTMTDLTETLLSRFEQYYDIQKVNIQYFCEQFKQRMQSIGGQYPIEFRFSFETEVIETEVSILEASFTELLKNSIENRKQDHTMTITISTFSMGSYHVIEWKDNGEGFNQSIFNIRNSGMYLKFSNKAMGKGLGLFILQSKLRSIGGFIEMEGKENEGVVVRLCFPRVQHKH